MSKFLNILKKTIKNPPILYVISRYGTFLLKFINSIFIALYLGPYYLGVWGFVNLVIGYIGQIDFGVSHSVNVLVAVNKEDESLVKKIIGNSLTMLIALSFFLILFLVIVYLADFKLVDKYELDKFIIPICTIGVLGYFKKLFSSLFRIFNDIFSIALNQSLFPLLALLILPFFRSEDLLWALVLVNCLSAIITFLYFLYKTPVKLVPKFNLKYIKLIQKKGTSLFIYNSAFVFIFLSTKTFVSSNFEVTEFGYFTFSFSLANVVLLLMNSLYFLVFPKLINRFSKMKNTQIEVLLDKVRISFITLSHLIIHLLILVFPIFLYFFPSFNEASTVFKVLALTIVLNTNSFGFQGLLMAKSKEKKLAVLASLALLLNITLLMFCIHYLHISFDMVVLPTMITYLIYIYFIAKYGRESIGLKTNIIDVLKDVYDTKIMIPFFLSLLIIALNLSNLYFLIPLIFFIIFNFNDIIKLKRIIMDLIKNPKLINI